MQTKDHIAVYRSLILVYLTWVLRPARAYWVKHGCLVCAEGTIALVTRHSVLVVVANALLHCKLATKAQNAKATMMCKSELPGGSI